MALSTYLDIVNEVLVLVPFATSAQPQVAGMPIFLGEACVGKDHHIIQNAFDNVLKGRTVIDIGRVEIPVNDQAQVVLQQTQFGADNPPCVRLAFASDLLWAASFSSRVNQFDAIGVDDAQHRRFSQEQVYPPAMRVEQAEETCSARQVGKQIAPISVQPAIESTVSDSLERKEQGQGDHFAGIERSLAMLAHIGHQVVYATKQFCDKILSTHGVLLSALASTPKA